MKITQGLFAKVVAALVTCGVTAIMDEPKNESPTMK
jgi:hypothetical protein